MARCIDNNACNYGKDEDCNYGYYNCKRFAITVQSSTCYTPTIATNMIYDGWFLDNNLEWQNYFPTKLDNCFPNGCVLYYTAPCCGISYLQLGMQREFPGDPYEQYCYCQSGADVDKGSISVVEILGNNCPIVSNQTSFTFNCETINNPQNAPCGDGVVDENNIPIPCINLESTYLAIIAEQDINCMGNRCSPPPLTPWSPFEDYGGDPEGTLNEFTKCGDRQPSLDFKPTIPSGTPIQLTCSTGIACTAYECTTTTTTTTTTPCPVSCFYISQNSQRGERQPIDGPCIDFETVISPEAPIEGLYYCKNYEDCFGNGYRTGGDDRLSLTWPGGGFISEASSYPSLPCYGAHLFDFYAYLREGDTITCYAGSWGSNVGCTLTCCNVDYLPKLPGTTCCDPTATTTTTTTLPPPPNCSAGSKSFSEYHGYDECPLVGKACIPENPVLGDCTSFTIGPVNIYSDPIDNICLSNQYIANINVDFDNFGWVIGKQGIIQAPATDACINPSLNGTVVPFIKYNTNNFQLYVKAFLQNAPHGGPYSINVSVDFQKV